jgi:DNA-binding IclR family transcriptional regulator
MPRGKPSPKLAITVDADVHGQVLAAAAAQGLSISAWMTEAARRALRREDGLAAVQEWEAKHGRLTEQEMDQARRRLHAGGEHRRMRSRRSA